MTDTITLTNGIIVHTGCWVEGSWGQYGPDHLADKIDGIIEIRPDDDPRTNRLRAEEADDGGHFGVASDWWERHHESGDRLIEQLNDITPPGWSFGWHEGEVFLWSTDQWRSAYGDEDDEDDED